MSYYIKADKFLLADGVKTDGYLYVDGEHFGQFVATVPSGSEIADWSGYTIAPGLFDTHIHGVQDEDVMDGSKDGVKRMSDALLPLGVTRFLPTTLTSSKADLDKAVVAVTAAVEEGLSGAQSAGIFLEGPYFTEKHKGAQNPSYFRDPDYAEFCHWQELAHGSIVKIALAPERDGAIDFIRKVRADGVLPSIAHTDASYQRCVEAVGAGAVNYVHLFNGMTGLHHRTPGVVGAALSDGRAFAELICDGHHVHPAMATFAESVKKDKLMLITDCMRAGLMPDGNYVLGEFPVVVKDGMAKTETGSLAGSILRLIDGVENLAKWSERPLHEIWHHGSLAPATSLGQDNQFGSIEQGKIADYVVFDDSFTVQATAIAGDVKYRLNEAGK